MVSALQASTLVPEPIRMDSLRCSEIICKNGGHSIRRNLDASMRWDVLYYRAVKNPDEYELKYDKEISSEVDDEGQITWVENDLARMSMPELRKIGNPLGVTSNDKTKLVSLILKAQAKRKNVSE